MTDDGGKREEEDEPRNPGQVGQAGQPGHEGVAGAGGQGGRGGVGQRGHAGSVGARGETGTTGQRGAQGAAGQRGQTGTTGTTGLAGAEGLQGAAGQRGQTGLAGLPGTTLDLETLATIASLDAETIAVLAALTPETLDVLGGLKESFDDQKALLAQVGKVTRQARTNRIIMAVLCVVVALGSLLYWQQRRGDAEQERDTVANVLRDCEDRNEFRKFNYGVYLAEAETAEEIVAREKKAAANPVDLTAVPGYDGLDRASKQFLRSIAVANAAEAEVLLQDAMLEAKVDRNIYETYRERFPVPACEGVGRD